MEEKPFIWEQKEHLQALQLSVNEGQSSPVQWVEKVQQPVKENQKSRKCVLSR